jgi:hypothetical protein
VVRHWVMHFALSGYESDITYDERVPDWELDTEFINTNSAIEAANAWLAIYPAGLVEVIEVEGDMGEVILLVTGSGIENIR